MSGLKLFRLLWCIVLLLAAGPAYCQESEAPLKEEAAKLFEAEKYLEATPLYLRLLALSPRSQDYNYRYGTCLLYNSYKKQDAFKYLNYAVTDPAIDPQAYYFLGKAYHLNYQFSEAIKNYEIYKQKVVKPKPSFETDRQIEMCQNAKKLMLTITDLVVLEKKEKDLANFFRSYDLKDNIGGDILVAADFQSKIDKKKGHVPLIHFPATSDVIYSSSYGETDNGHKDIYMRKRLPDGSWGKPQLVQGGVNTKYDEDFPYMHPGGEYLYFCSKGHNSMGGYDVFRSKLDPSTGSFGTPENMDFAISSPDDDIFYVVDSLDKNAWFASSRQSSNGNIHVYKVRVERVPLQLAVVKGQFASGIHPDNKKITITVTDFASGTNIGTFTSNENGAYLITLPKGGKYQYDMKVAGSSVSHKYILNVPYKKEFKPLKQKIREELLESDEVVKVTDLFDEDVDDPMGVLAEVIKQRSELNPNASQFNLQELDAGRENQKILTELGFENSGPQDIVATFERLQNKQQEKVKQSENLANGALSEASKKLDEAAKQQEAAKSLVNRANSAETKQQKFELLSEAKEKITNAEGLETEARMLIAFSDSVTKKGTAEKDLFSSIEAVTTEVKKEVAANNMSELKTLITGNSRTIDAVKNDNEKDPVDVLIEQKMKIAKDKANWTQQQDNYAKSEETLDNEIRTLRTELAEAKKKDQPAIESKIASKTSEKDLVSEEKQSLEKKILKATKQEDELNKRIAFLQGVTQVGNVVAVSPSEVQNKLNSVDSRNNNTLASYISKQVEDLKKDPELATTSSENVPVAALGERHGDHLASIDSETFASPADKTRKQLAADREFAIQIDQQLEEAEAELKKNPSNAEAQSRKEELTDLKAKTDNRIAAREKELARQQQTAVDNTEPAVKITPETELKTLDPNHTEALAEAKATTAEKTLEAKNKVDEALLTKVERALNEVEAQLEENPDNKSANDRKKALLELKNQTAERIADRQAGIERLNGSSSEITSAETELNALMPDYEAQIAGVSGETFLEKLEAENAIDRELAAKIDDEIEDVEGQLMRNPDNAEAQQRQEALKELKTAVDERISTRNDEIEKATSDPAAENFVAETVERIRPEYKENIGKIEATMDDGPKKELALLNEERDLLTAIDKQIVKKEAEAVKDPGNAGLRKEISQLKEVQAVQEAKVSERELELTAIEKAKIDPDRFRSDIMPDYRVPEISNRGNYSEEEINTFTQQEQKLQNLYTKKLRANEKKLEKSFDPKPAAENKVIATLMEQSVNRSQQLHEPVTEDPAITERIAADLGDDSDMLMNSNPETVDEAKRIITELKEYEADQTAQLNILETADPVDEEAVNQQQQLLIVVRQRIGEVEAGLDDLESATTQNNHANNTTTVPENTTDNVVTNAAARNELQQLTQTEAQLEKKLATSSVTPAEKRTTEKELATVRKQKQEQETLVLKNDLSAAQHERRLATQQLNSISDPVADAAIKRSEGLTAKTTERPSVGDLTKQLQGEEQALVLLKTTNDYLGAKQFYDEKGLVKTTRSELEAQKRRFLVENGQLELVIQELQKDPAKSAETNELRSQKNGIVEAVEQIDKMIAQLETEKAPENPVKKGLDASVSYETEIELARSRRYPALQERYRAVQATHRQIAELIREKDQVRSQLAAAREAEEEALTKQLAQLSEDEKIVRSELKQQQTALDKQLQETGQPEAYRNLLARDVPQAKAAAPVAAAILPSIGNGFELVSTPAPTRTANIPVGLKAPTGLVYRVQVGAFANPIREDLFREFTPVTGDKLDNGITRYMAGYFGNRDRASDAQRQIRTLGYKDAFVVAYCDGNRISLAEAKRLEDLGLCVPKNQDSLLLEIVENTLAQLPADSAEKLRPGVRPSDYNKAPGAAVAEAAEEHKGLYYTVQVGVYNRPATAEQVRNIEPLLTKRLENGQIRYSSGMFPGIDAARPKKAEAVARGISDAFVTAYYNGERISLDEAKRILSEQGPTVLEKEMTPIRPDAIGKAEQYAATKPVVPTAKEERVQFVSKETYESYPRETIARLNSHGSFYYDTEDQRIKSVEYVPKNALSMLDDLSDELDTVKTVKNTVYDEPMAVKVVAVWESAEISGATADWILRLTQAHTGTAKGEGFELTFENILPEDREDLVYVLESYGADEVRVEEEKQ